MTTDAKTPIEIRDAFFEWLTSVGIGVLPLLSHMMIHTINPVSQNTSTEGWTVDVLFVAIATAGTSIASVFARFAKGSYRMMRLGPSAIFLMTVTVVLLTLSAMEYGVVACGRISSASLGVAAGLTIGASLASLAFELGIATGAALSPLESGEA